MTSHQKQLHQSTRKMATWTLIWLISMAIASFGPTFIWDSNTTITIFSIVTNMIIGLFMIRTNVKYILSLDEMLQRIHLEAMSVSLGVGIVIGFGYSLLAVNDILPSKLGMPVLAVVFSITYLIVLFRSHRSLG